MAKHNLETLKRSHICSVLRDNKWDYLAPSKLSLVFSKCVMEILSWYSRRGNKLTPMLIQTLSETICLKEGLGAMDSAKICSAIQKFISSPIYTKIEFPVGNYEAMMKVGKQNTLTYIIPMMEQTDKSLTAIS